MTNPADHSQGDRLAGEVTSEVTEADIPSIIERGGAGEKLTSAEQAAWSGYELGWRDGRADALASPTRQEQGVSGAENDRAELTPETKAAIAHDRAYRAGVRAGYNLGVVEDREAMNRLCENITNEIVQAKNAERASSGSPSDQQAPVSAGGEG